MFQFRRFFARGGQPTRRAASRNYRPSVESLERRDVPAPLLLDPHLTVGTVVSGLDQPTSMAFLGPNDFLVLEKATGKVQRIRDGALVSTVLDLPVNSGSERGLLGIALHPNFATNGFTYLYWTQSSTGADTSTLNQTSVLGNRVDRYVWTGQSLRPDRNIIQLRALQQDAGQPERGNQDGGVLKFGPDGKLYIFIGDNGRRGQTQNLSDGPGPAGNSPDDQFGGPEPDSAHATGAIFRLNDDGSTPTDNPFFRAGALRGGEVGNTLQKIFAYGVRNGSGMTFDPVSGNLWDLENGDDSFSELNRVVAGANLGWVQFMGPVSRIAEFKTIETSTAIDPVTRSSYAGLQQVRWDPANIANTPEEALERLYHVYEGGNRFTSTLTGSQEVPVVNTTAAASATVELLSDGTLQFTLRATANITGVTNAHFHLGPRGVNGPVVVPLFGPVSAGVNFQAGDIISQGSLRDFEVNQFLGFDGTATSLAERMRQGRVYTNIHTLANPGGHLRGKVVVDGQPVSRYVDPDFSWKYEVAPGAVGFIAGSGLGAEYQGDMITGTARTFLEGGPLFRFDMTRDRLRVDLRDTRLQDRVADNLNKFDITESGSLLFGINFGIITDILTGPDGLLYLVSNTDGAVYRISRTPAPAGGFNPQSPEDSLGEDSAREFLLAVALADLSGATGSGFLVFPDPSGQPAASVALPPTQRPEELAPPVVDQEQVPVTPASALSRLDRDAGEETFLLGEDGSPFDGLIRLP